MRRDRCPCRTDNASCKLTCVPWNDSDTLAELPLMSSLCVQQFYETLHLNSSKHDDQVNISVSSPFTPAVYTDDNAGVKATCTERSCTSTVPNRWWNKKHFESTNNLPLVGYINLKHFALSKWQADTYRDCKRNKSALARVWWNETHWIPMCLSNGLTLLYRAGSHAWRHLIHIFRVFITASG